MSDPNTESGRSAELATRLRSIEEQPLESRAPAFAEVYDLLQAQLEGGDMVTRNG
jgi:hypothetical protein